MIPLKPGDVLRNRYEIVALIGQGGMGCLYRAADRRLEGRVTASSPGRPAPHARGRDQDRQQFQRKQTLWPLDHPNLPKVSDSFAQDERHFL
jgi:serine/threonine protein kinase